MSIEEVFFILIQNIQKDPITRLFTWIILTFFFIGLTPTLIAISSQILTKIPLLNKASKNPFVILIFGILGIGTGIYIGLHSLPFSLLVIFFFLIILAPRLNQFSLANKLSIKPALLTTMGILGTFVGIYMGLHNFNIFDIDQSIPALLSGLKTAFTTSIVGMVAAIFLKLMQSIKIPAAGRGQEDSANIFEDIHQTLQKHLEQSQTQHQQILNTIQNDTESQQNRLHLFQLKIEELTEAIKKIK